MSATSRPTRRTRLGLLELGAKVVPAVVFAQFDLDEDGAADDIRITGDAGKNLVVITENANDTVHVTIDGNGDGDLADKGDVDLILGFTAKSFVIEAKLGGGNDEFRYFATADVDGARGVTADLGGGNDRFDWNSLDFEVIPTSRVTLDVTAGAGNDQGNIIFGGIDAATVSVRTDWGPGSDTYGIGVFGQIDGGAAVDVTTDLGGGTNVLVASFSGVGKFEAGTLDVAVTGGPKTDKVFVALTDDVGAGVNAASRVNIAADLGAGDDAFVAEFQAGSFLIDNLSQVSIAARGGAGNDTLLARMTGETATTIQAGGRLSIALDGGAGNDEAGVDFADLAPWKVEEGAVLQIRLDGGAGTDALDCRVADVAGSFGDFDIALRGGTGDDAVTNDFQVNGGPSFGPALGIVLDGGTGTDTAFDLNPFVSIRTGFETVN